MRKQSVDISAILKAKILEFSPSIEPQEIGEVLSVSDGIAVLWGLADVGSGEMLEFESGVRGMALNLTEETVGAVIFGMIVISSKVTL